MSDFDEFYEWAIMHPPYAGVEPHRGPMTEAEARRWLKEAEKGGIRPGLFYLAKRMVSPWVKVED